MALGVGDIVKTTVNFLLVNGVQYQNVYHHIFDGIGGVSDAAVVADIKAWVEDAYDEIVAYAHEDTAEQLCFVDQVEWTGTEWEVVANIGTFTPTWVPVGGSSYCPNQVAPFITFKTARPKSVGRKFMFPCPEASQNLGVMGAPMIAALVAFATIIVNDLTLDVANVLHPGVPRTGFNDWLNFTVAVVTDLLGTQRRRRPGYGA